MAAASGLEAWLFAPQFWVFAALALIGADMLLGLQYFALAVGVAALAMAGLLVAAPGLWPAGLAPPESWRGIAVWFAAFSVASVLLIRLAFQNFGRGASAKPDINEY